MKSLTGVTILAQEQESHKGWNPRFGVWKPLCKKISENTAIPGRPILEEVKAAASLALPEASIVWRGPNNPADSVGGTTFDSLAALCKMGLADRVRFQPLEDWKVPVDYPAIKDDRVKMVHDLIRDPAGPEDMEIQAPGILEAEQQNCVRHLFYEFEALPEIPMRPGDVLWPPSHYVGQKLQKLYPDNRVIVAPHGVDTGVYHPGAEPRWFPEEKFRFLYMGTTISRKGIDLVLESFLEEREKMPDAELVLKVFPTTSGFIWKEIYNQPEGIRIIEEVLSPSRLASLYRGCDVLMAPARAEGFCKPVLEAMACGLPCIVPNGSAMDDFCPQDSRYSIESDIVKAAVGPQGITFTEPRKESLRKCLREAYEDREGLKRRGQKAAEAAKHFTWEAATRMLVAKSWEAFQSR